jgi:replicative DNA helicase
MYTPTEQAVGYLPPQAIELEKSLLGAIIIENAKPLADMPFINPELFYHSAHVQIWEAIRYLYLRGDKVDMLTVIQRLADMKKLDNVGGASYIVGLTQTIGSGSHAVDHAMVLYQKYIERELLLLSKELERLGLSTEVDIAERVSKAGMLVGNLLDLTNVNSKAGRVDRIVEQALDEAYLRCEHRQSGIPIGIPTGLRKLDSLTGGFAKGELTILAARPSMGKTAMMLHFAKSAAEAGHHAVIFSLEMKAVRIIDRVLMSVARNIDIDRFKQGELSQDEMQELEAAGAYLANLPISVDENSDASIYNIRATAQSLKNKGRCDIIFIDYLGLIKEHGMNGRNREQNIAAISRMAKVMAKELDVPVVLLSQLNRVVESRADKIPQLADLRESGAVEQDADVVLMLFRPKPYGLDPILNTKTNRELENAGLALIRKNRDGAIGQLPFYYNDSLTKLADVTSDINPFSTTF